MDKKKILALSKRERQIMDVIYTLGEATASQVVELLPEDVGDASVRKLIRVVEQKGFLEHRREGHSYIYSPTVAREDASVVAMKHTLQTFFQDDVPKAVATLMDLNRDKLSEEDIAELNALIARAEQEGNEE